MMRLWWLSFADPARPKGTQFLGVSIIEAPGFGSAVLAAHLLGCNPGGEVHGYEIPERFHAVITRDYLARLMQRPELEELDRLMGGTGVLVRPE